MDCLLKVMTEFTVWLFGVKQQCPDLSESAKIGVSVMFSTLFVIVLLFAIMLKRRMTIIEVCLIFSTCRSYIKSRYCSV
jgi:hypothetical protein